MKSWRVNKAAAVLQAVENWPENDQKTIRDAKISTIRRLKHEIVFMLN